MSPEQIKKIIAEKVEGKWQAEHDASGHHYRHIPTNILVDSVTTKLIAEKPHLLKWSISKAIEWLEQYDRWERLKGPDRSLMLLGSQEAYTEFRDDAGSVGSAAHQVAENFLNYRIEKGFWPEDIRKGFKDGADPRAIASARSIEMILKKLDVIPISSELLVGSIRHRIAGTLDLLALIDNKLSLIDFKTSNAVSDEYANQVAAYKYCFEEMSGLKIKTVKIFHLSKKYDKCIVYNVPNLPSAYKAYKGIATFYDWFNNGKEKLEKDIKKIVL